MCSILVLDMSFSLVKLWENGEVEEGVVPTKWIVDGRVYWSNGINAEKHLKQQRAVDLNWPSYELIRVVFADGMLFINVYLKGLHSKLKNFPFVNNIMILKDNKRKKKRKYFLAWILYKICVVPRLI